MSRYLLLLLIVAPLALASAEFGPPLPSRVEVPFHGGVGRSALLLGAPPLRLRGGLGQVKLFCEKSEVDTKPEKPAPVATALTRFGELVDELGTLL